MRRSARIALVLIVVLCAMMPLSTFAQSPLEGLPQEVVAGIYDASSDAWLAGQNLEKPHAIASLSKLMTISLIFDALDAGTLHASDVLTYTEAETSLIGSDVPLRPGQTVTVEEAISLLMVRSANSAALLLAKADAGNEAAFVEKMNARAAALGMQSTHFINAHGLPVIATDAQNTSTAQDLARLVADLVKRHPQVFTYSAMPSYRLSRYAITVKNTNPILGYRGVDGLKTGTTTAAGKCLIATTTEPAIGSGDTRRIFTFVLGARTDAERISDSKKLVDNALDAYDLRRIAPADRPYAMTLDHVRFAKDEISLFPEKDLDAVVCITKTYKLKHTFYEAPDHAIRKGEALGELELLEDGKPIRKILLIAGEDVEKNGWFKRTWRGFLKLFS